MMFLSDALLISINAIFELISGIRSKLLSNKLIDLFKSFNLISAFFKSDSILGIVISWYVFSDL